MRVLKFILFWLLLSGAFLFPFTVWDTYRYGGHHLDWSVGLFGRTFQVSSFDLAFCLVIGLLLTICVEVFIGTSERPDLDI